MILEDDFMFLVDKPTFEENLRSCFASNIEYDVLLLGCLIKKSEPFNEILSYGREIETTSGYIVHKAFYDTLINTWEIALENLIATNMHWLYALDQSWKTLQMSHKFLCFNTRIGKQRSSWSDNRNCFTEYDA
jgi:hypothetical protein